MKDRIGVIFGGRSGEHEISLMSAASVIRALDKEKHEVLMFGIDKEGRWHRYEGPPEDIPGGGWQVSAVPMNPSDLKDKIDFALPILHGTYGEDGTVQGFFEILDLPYGGCGVLASALAMDKFAAKELYVKAGLPTCKYRLFLAKELKGFDLAPGREAEAFEERLKDIEEYLGYPMFVKPANLGSSVGIGKVNDRKSLKKALFYAACYDRRLILEEAIVGRELETGVLGNYAPEVAAVGEIFPSGEFYDYKAKYFDGGQSKMQVPADLPPEIAKEIQEIAKKAYGALDCAGFARVDFFMEKDTNKIYINEINTIPGFTEYSMFPLLWEASGLSYSELMERIVGLGYERYYAKNNRETV